MLMNEEDTQKLRQIELQILCEIDRVCRENGIGYFLDSGTLLGAVRHHGFIPWDDDIDVGMVREDYDRFLKIAPGKLRPEYLLEAPGRSSSVRFSFSKVRRRGTTFLESATSSNGSPDGIWVDIFPFDWIEGSPKNVEKKKVKWRRRHKLMLLRVVPRARHDASALKKVARSVVRLPLFVHGKAWYCDRLDQLADSREPERGSVLTCFHYYSAFPALTVSDVYPFTEAQFEGHMFSILHNPCEYLAQVYGDWQQLPPVNQRIPHHDIVKIDFGNVFDK